MVKYYYGKKRKIVTISNTHDIKKNWAMNEWNTISDINFFILYDLYDFIFFHYTYRNYT